MQNTEKIFKKLAYQNHTTVENIRNEITLAIELGMKNSNADVRKIWKSMSKTGTTPTPEETIEYIAKMIIHDTNK